MLSDWLWRRKLAAAQEGGSGVIPNHLSLCAHRRSSVYFPRRKEGRVSNAVACGPLRQGPQAQLP